MNLKSTIFSLLPKDVKQKINQKITKEAQEKKFNEGYDVFLKTGQTTQEFYINFIDLYCSSNGKFNEEFNNKLKKENPSANVNSTLEGVPGKFSANDFIKFNSELNEKGYSHFEKKINKELCEKLFKYALQTPAKIPNQERKITYSPENPISEIYRIDIQDQVNNPDIQRLIMDPVLINIARNYLGCEPIFDFPAMWWSTAFKKEASEEAAQLYHFDMDRIKWLKIFFYINDVNMENGPHSYISGSHRPGSKPDEILKRGYKRIPDEDLFPYYKPDDIKVICGEAGSMFAGDTKCWHKGTNLKKGHRLVLELEYTSSLFGANYPKLEVTNFTKEFKSFCLENKRYASNIQFKN